MRHLIKVSLFLLITLQVTVNAQLSSEAIDILDSIDPEVSVPGVLDVASALPSDVDKLRVMVRELELEKMREEVSALKVKLSEDGSGASASLDVGEVREKGFWAACKRNPKTTTGTILGTLVGVYFLGENNGWWESGGDSRRDKDIDKGILVEDSQDVTVTYKNGRGETDQLKIVNSKGVRVEASDEPEPAPVE